MPIILKILFSQVLILFISIFAAFPFTIFADFLEKKFGTFEKGVGTMVLSQLILIAVNIFIFIWCN